MWVDVYQEVFEIRVYIWGSSRSTFPSIQTNSVPALLEGAARLLFDMVHSFLFRRLGFDHRGGGAGVVHLDRRLGGTVAAACAILAPAAVVAVEVVVVLGSEQ